MTITVNSPVTPTFTPVNPVCSGSTINALPTTSTNGITGTWSPALNNTATTTYTFTPDAGQCATTTTLTIIVSSTITPTFTPVNPICSGNVISALPATSTNGITGTWSPALNNTATTTYTFTPDPGQCGVSTTMAITVISIPSAPTDTTIQPGCTSTSGSITVTVPASGVMYSFDNGNTFSGNATGSNLLPNTYQVVVKTIAGGCISPASPVTINTPPIVPAIPAVSIAQPDCFKSTGTITVTNALNGENYSFDNGATFGPSATSTLLASGTYQVIVKNTVGGCLSAVTSATITPQPLVPQAPVAMVTQPTCTVATGIITVTSPSSGVMYSFDNGNTYQSSAVSPGLSANATYQLVVQGIVGSCSSPATSETINPQPVVPDPPTVISPVNYCEHDTTAIPLVASTVFGNTLNWYDANGAIGSVAPTPSTAAGGSTTYSVTSFNGTCESPKSTIVVNVDPISAYAGGPVVDVNQGQPVTLNGTANGDNKTITWSPDTYLSSTSISDPMVTALSDITYTMRVSSPDGCKASDTVQVIVLKNLIIPNAFSPNGDGINDKWLITYLDEYASATVSIFNRYGQLIYQSNPGGYSSRPWDGTYNGSPVPIGTYYYIIKLSANKAPLSGSISVIR
jgi:gliding motility-associated-like protein